MITDTTALESWLERRLGQRHPVAAAAVVSPEGSLAVVRGAATDADFEIGSISKGITGLLYADAVHRGEVTPTTRLGDLLPLDGSAAAGVSLSALSTHTSGLPRLPAGARPYRRTLQLWRHGVNPYGESLSELLQQAQGVKLAAPKPRYSNFGFELLGHAIASAAGLSYQQLVAERIATPLALPSMYAPTAVDELRSTALTGRSKRGRTMQPWTGEAIAPAGGIRSSIEDMARLSAALLERSAPGVAALDPVRDFSGGLRIGAAWLTLTVRGTEITWHNGGTGGFRSWIGIDRNAGTACVILSATSVSVDGHGFALLQESS
jgi:CubicO group peptidase (beta-lactamase class C family)